MDSQSQFIPENQTSPLGLKQTYLLPLGEKQSANISSNASRRILKLGERETRQIHLSANEFAGMR